MKIKKYTIPESTRIYKPKAPFMAEVLSTIELTEANSRGEVRNIVLDVTGSGILYVEGQSIGIVPPGEREPGKAHKARLYSIASARTGDDGTSTTATICIKRVYIEDEATGEILPGVASNYLCNLKPGDLVPLIGPNGRRFLLPEDDSTDLILIAVGTGIAPFRAFVRHIFLEKGFWNGRIRLFYGVKNAMEALFLNTKNDDIGQYMTQQTFEAFRALSRVDKEDAEKGYVQHKLAEHKQEVWEMICAGNFALYICGLKGMEQGVDEVFAELAEQQQMDWPSMKAEFIKSGQWNTEVY
ncbi:MAG: ferredoxin--NADP(+) reductase [Pseudomonadota bacterium]